MGKEIIKTKKEIVEMLNNLISYALSDDCNVFDECRYNMYANNGLNKLHELNANDDDLIKMYDINDELYFEKVIDRNEI